MKKKVLSLYVVSLLLFRADASNAGIVDAGIWPAITKNYVIDEFLSSATFLDASSSLNTQGLSGSFEVNFFHDYRVFDDDDDLSTPEDRYTKNRYGVYFRRPNIWFENGLFAGLQFPIYAISSERPYFSNSSVDASVCDVPYGLCNYAFDFNQYEIPAFSGLIENGRIIFDGSQTNAQGGYTYHVEAYVVPVPAAFWLFASVLNVMVPRLWRGLTRGSGHEI